MLEKKPNDNSDQIVVNRESGASKLLEIGGMLFVAMILYAIFSNFGNKLIGMVQGGKLATCPHVTVEQMANSFMGSPSWDSGVSDTGQTFVNLSGEISYHDKKVQALIQFFVDEDNGTFQFNALEFNGEPQIEVMAIALLGKMCQSVPGDVSTNK